MIDLRNPAKIPWRGVNPVIREEGRRREKEGEGSYRALQGFHINCWERSHRLSWSNSRLIHIFSIVFHFFSQKFFVK